MQKTLNRMRKHGFTVVELDTAEQAKDYLLANIPDGSSVGVGGSISVRETGVLPALLEKGCEIIAHWDVKPEERPPVYRKAHTADVYLTSANALTKHGELVLVDGVGGRVGAVAAGPGQVYFIVSHSKWVDGGYGAAIARIRRDACPPNAHRQDKRTPCAEPEGCNPESCVEDCMCRMTLALERVPYNTKMTMLFIREKLGY